MAAGAHGALPQMALEYDVDVRRVAVCVSRSARGPLVGVYLKVAQVDQSPRTIKYALQGMCGGGARTGAVQ